MDWRNRLRNPVIAQENIAFQKGLFFKSLTDAFAIATQSTLDNKALDSLVEQLTGIIKHFTNANNVKFNIGEYGPAVHIPDVKRNHVFLDNLRRNYGTDADGVKLIQNAKKAPWGKVDLETGLLLGVFRDIQMQFEFPLDFLKDTAFTAEEKAAVLLHEVGHVLTYAITISRQCSTNQVLAAVRRSYLQPSYEERVVVLKEFGTAFNIKDIDAKEVAKLPVEAVEIIVLKEMMTNPESSLGSSLYDEVSWEQNADEYASRQGAGRHLITALDKIYRKYGALQYRGLVKYWLMEALKIALLAAAFAGGIGVAAAGAPVLLVYPLFGLLIYFASADANNDTYDQPKRRLERIRNTMTEQLKFKNLPKDQVLQITEDIETLNNLITDISERVDLASYIIAIFSSGVRNKWKAVRMQSELEDLANNRLFSAAARLQAV